MGRIKKKHVICNHICFKVQWKVCEDWSWRDVVSILTASQKLLPFIEMTVQDKPLYFEETCTFARKSCILSIPTYGITESVTVMCLIMTFLSMTDHIYDMVHPKPRGVGGCTVYVCVSAFCDVHTTMKLLTDILFRT